MLKFPNFNFVKSDRHSRMLFCFADLFEEDIIMDRRLRSWVTGQFDKRDAINEVSYLWPTSERDGKRIVRIPYTLSKEIEQGERAWRFLVV